MGLWLKGIDIQGALTRLRQSKQPCVLFKKNSTTYFHPIMPVMVETTFIRSVFRPS
jgi:hypothetical protein